MRIETYIEAAALAATKAEVAYASLNRMRTYQFPRNVISLVNSIALRKSNQSVKFAHKYERMLEEMKREAA